MGRAISVFLLIVLFWAGIFYLKREDISLDSPIPRVFGTSREEIKNDWFPRTSFFAVNGENSLSLSAKSAVTVVYETGEVIFNKNIHERLPVSSTVKIMTALVVLENSDLDRAFTVSQKAASVGENSMGLGAGEKLTARELLLGMMLVSGNDAALALAEGIVGSEEEFVGLMNAKAERLGLKNSYFVNSSGLDEDGKEQYSSAYDLAVIARYTWENFPEFRRIVSAVHEYIEANENHKAFDLYNDTNLLTTYPGVRGIKPGFTWEAGLCLVTYAENGGKKVLAVVLGSDDRRGEMKELLDFSFAYFGIKVDHPALD
ncbi:D-alanyl-D-alanine carboxypeptidase [Candidatus Curtissbacteria bacterium]|nr:D-alanyl-D-alanine carboxypeptidase [Candidatus Curtissbacteria bacterium]